MKKRQVPERKCLSGSSGRVFNSVEDAGFAIAAMRVQKGLTQMEMANQAGISRKAYGKIECGRSDMKISTLVRILQALDADPDGVLLRKRSGGPADEKEKGEAAALVDDVPPSKRAQFLAVMKIVRDGLLAGEGSCGTADTGTGEF